MSPMLAPWTLLSGYVWMYFMQDFYQQNTKELEHYAQVLGLCGFFVIDQARKQICKDKQLIGQWNW